MEVVSNGKYIRISPKKVKLLTDQFINLPVERALISLRFVPNKASTPLIKVLKTAIADATHNYKLDQSKLVIKKIEVGEGPRLKRSIARSRGMAHPILKRTTHIKVVLGD